MIRSIGLACCIALTGCASNNLYQWGGYEDHLYAAYKDPTKVEAFRLKLESLLQEAQQSGRRVAPGLGAIASPTLLRSCRQHLIERA